MARFFSHRDAEGTEFFWGALLGFVKPRNTLNTRKGMALFFGTAKATFNLMKFHVSWFGFVLTANHANDANRSFEFVI